MAPCDCGRLPTVHYRNHQCIRPARWAQHHDHAEARDIIAGIVGLLAAVGALAIRGFTASSARLALSHENRT
jgi:hypothetical protein